MNIFDFVATTHAARVSNQRRVRFNRLKLSAGKLNRTTFVQAMREAHRNSRAFIATSRVSPYAGLFITNGVTDE